MISSQQLEPRHVARFRAAVGKRTGLALGADQLAALSTLLRRRIGASGLSAEAYVAALESPPAGKDEVRVLAGELTVAETYFFRHADQLRACSEVAFRDGLRASETARPFRVLSAGCASGEEAYSLAMLILERPEAARARAVSIHGVDINPAMLEKAARGRFSGWSLRETPSELRARYFHAEGDELVLDERVRRMVTFEEQNLVHPTGSLWRAEAFDVVFCRNVLMYFQADAAAAVVQRIARSLVPGGFLFLGSAETLRGLSEDFNMRNSHGAFYYQRKDQLGSSDRESPPPSIARLYDATPPPLVGEEKERESRSWADEIGRASERIRSLTDAPSPDTAPADPASGAAPERGDARADLGRVVELLRQESYPEARQALARLPAASLGDPEALLLRALLLTHGGDLRAAEELCREILGLDEGNAGAHYLAALCRESAGDRPGAVDHHRRATRIDPAFALPHLHLGLLARRSGDDQSARRQLAEALTLLQREDASRLTLFAGGFSRDALSRLCTSELVACGGAR